MHSEMQGLFQMRIRHDLVYPNIKSKVYEFAHQNLSQRQLSSTRHNYVLDFECKIQYRHQNLTITLSGFEILYFATFFKIDKFLGFLQTSFII